MSNLPETDHTHVEQKDVDECIPVRLPVEESSWLPTRKWIANVVTGLGTVVGAWITTGAFDAEEKGILAALVLMATSTYFFPNQPTPGGIPQK